MFSKYNDVGTLKCQEKAHPVRLHPRLLDVVQPSTVALLRAGLAAEFLELACKMPGAVGSSTAWALSAWLLCSLFPGSHPLVVSLIRPA